MITRTATHALRALVALARLPAGEHAGALRIARIIDAPPNYLGKLLHTLAGAGLLHSQKGLGGGFRLALPPRQIALLDIIEPIEHISRTSGCILGRGECTDEGSCPIHEEWKKVRGSYLRMLSRNTIADLVAREDELLRAI